MVRCGSHPSGVASSTTGAGVGAVVVMVMGGGAERGRATRSSRHGTNGSDGSVTRQPVLQQEPPEIVILCFLLESGHDIIGRY
jgi:hypothetical protein